jgi:very-short-patch-repair endonuclease
MTEAEQILWTRLRARRFFGFKFRRQVPIGQYIVDFVCFNRRVVIELDGGGHGEAQQKQYDAVRTHWLESQRFRVVRFWNFELREDNDAIEELIWQRLHDETLGDVAAPSPPTPLPQGERGDGTRG